MYDLRSWEISHGFGNLQTKYVLRSLWGPWSTWNSNKPIRERLSSHIKIQTDAVKRHFWSRFITWRMLIHSIILLVSIRDRIIKNLKRKPRFDFCNFWIWVQFSNRRWTYWRNWYRSFGRKLNWYYNLKFFIWNNIF